MTGIVVLTIGLADFALCAALGAGKTRVANVSHIGASSAVEVHSQMKNDIGVLHVCAPAEYGGLEQVVRTLASQQKSSGHRVRVLAFVDSNYALHPAVEALVQSGVTVSIERLGGRAYLAERRAVARACAGFAPNVVHTHGYRTDVVDAGVARRMGIPIVSTVHGFTGGGWRNRLYERLQRLALRRFAAVVAVCSPLARQLVHDGLPAQRVHVVPNAWVESIEPLPRDAARRRLRAEPGEFVAGWVGRLSHEKGPDVFLKTLSLLRDEGVVGHVLGSGRERDSLQSLSRDLGVHGAVKWHGAVPLAAELFAGFDVFVLSSRTEGTPIALFEAMAAGTPIVATSVGGVPDVVGDKEAGLVPPEDPAALSDAISAVRLHADVAAKRATAARRRLGTDFNPQTWVARYEAIYRSVASP